MADVQELLSRHQFREAGLLIDRTLDDVYGSASQPLTDAGEVTPTPHGELQLRAVLRDRPAMATRIHPNDTAWRIVASLFGNQQSTFRVFWSNDIRHVRESEPRARTVFSEDDTAYVQVALLSHGRHLTHDELWSALIFELHNARLNNRRSHQMETAAARNRISRNEYVLKIARYECDAVKAAQRFYARVYLPLMIDGSAEESHARNWWCLNIVSINEYMEQLTDHDEYPWVPYGRDYDEIQAAADFDGERFQEALIKYDRLAATADEPTEIAAYFKASGLCYARLGLHESAVASFEKSLQAAATNDGKAEIHYLIAIENNALRNFSTASRHLTAAMDADRGGAWHARSLLFRIRIETAIGDIFAVRVSCEEFLSKFPNEPSRHEVMQTMQSLGLR